MIELISQVKQHFDPLQDQFTASTDFGFQAESWFKAELLMALNQLRKTGIIQELDREVRVGTQKVDIVLRYQGVQHWVELKHWLIGKQKRTLWRARDYFTDGSTVGITQDVQKLSAISGPDQCWLLLLLTANPDSTPWQAGLDGFHAKFAPYRLVAQTRPEEFPPSYFLAALELARS